MYQKQNAKKKNTKYLLLVYPERYSLSGEISSKIHYIKYPKETNARMQIYRISISGSFTLFHWSSCLFLYQCHAVFITMAP
jgi:hypothetical protein